MNIAMPKKIFFIVLQCFLLSFNSMAMNNSGQEEMLSTEVQKIYETVHAEYKSSESFAPFEEYVPWIMQQTQSISHSGLQALLINKFVNYARMRTLIYSAQSSFYMDLDMDTIPFDCALIKYLKYGQCGEQAAALILSLLETNISYIALYVIQYKSVNHAFVVVRDYDGKDYAIDLFLDIKVPLEDYWTHERLLSYFRQQLKDQQWTPNHNAIIMKNPRPDDNGVFVSFSSGDNRSVEVARIKKRVKELEIIVKAANLDVIVQLQGSLELGSSEIVKVLSSLSRLGY